MKKKLTKSKLIVVFIVILVLFAPLSINLPKQTDSRAFIIGVGVDKGEDDGYILSAQVLVPESEQIFKETLQVYSSEGKNILECVEHMSLHFGKIAGFGNVSVIVFGSDMAKEGIIPTLDFFMRSSRLNDNATIVTTNKKAKDLLQAVSDIDKSFSYSINNLSKLNTETAISHSTNMSEFMGRYYGISKASFVSQIRLEQDDNLGIDTKGQPGNSTTQSSSQSQNSSQDSVVSNNGYTSVFVDGKEIDVFGPEQLVGFENISSGMRGAYSIKNVSDEYINNADVDMSIKNRIRRVEYKFKNGIPQVYYHLRYTVKVENIREDGNNLILDGTKNYVSKEVKNKFKQLIQSQVAESINLSKQYNADVLNIQNEFFKYKNKDWKKYYAKLPDKSEAYKNIEFFLDVEVDGIV